MASRDAVSWNSGERWGDDDNAGLSEDISGCKQEKEERQADENRLRMKQEEREDATLSRETQGQQEALAENKGE